MSSANSDTKIVVFTNGLSYSVNQGILAIDKVRPGITWLVIVHRPSKTAKQLIRSQWLNLKRNGPRWIPYQTRDIVERLLERILPKSKTDKSDQDSAERNINRLDHINVTTVEDINSPETADIVREFCPYLGLSIAAPILKESSFSVPVCGTLNLHKGELPWYRGMPPAFWELWNDESSVGCSVHWVDSKFDTGDILRKTTVPIDKYSTLKGLQLVLEKVGIDLMRDAALDVLNKEAIASKQADGGKTYRKPTLGQFAALEKKVALKQPQSASQVRRLIKNTMFGTLIILNRLIFRRFVTPRVAVLLYHRVCDDARDNLTVGIEQFDRQMEIVKKYYHVISLEQLIFSESLPTSSKPVVCVTFDDGYLDNYEHAAPILKKHRIPAAFFVSTGIIEEQGTFPHDVRRGNESLPVMNWQQIKEMHNNGFTIGSHTVNHIDCASEGEDIVQSELQESLATVRKELGIQDVIFAYPYGGKEHMTSERLKLVKQAGYVACLSAYGGVNVGEVDRFNVLRFGMQNQFSDLGFRYRCEGF